jgi:hypothetical protein
MSCGVRQAVPCAASLRLVGWTVPVGAAHVHCRGYLGSEPHKPLDLGALEYKEQPMPNVGLL